MAEAALVDEIRAIWADSDGTYGSPRVCAELRRRGRRVNYKRVERLMKRHHMAGFVPPKRRVTTTADGAHRIPDLLEGDFGAARPDEAWVGDIGEPQTVRTIGLEATIHQIGGSGRVLIWDGRAPLFAPHHAFQAFLAHQAFHSAPYHRHSLTLKLAPYPAGSVYPEVRLPNTADPGA